jgi:hypothetical protein
MQKREQWIITNEDGTLALVTTDIRRPMEWRPLAEVNGYYPSRADALPACYGRDGARPLRISEGS